jgi:hypothetical protein
MEDNGYNVKAEDVQDLSAVKSEYQVPLELQSCHTAIVDGYVIEGHVPAADIERLLDEQPDIVGLAVPGMPIGSPGMEVEGAQDEPYEVIAFDNVGNWQIFASHGR